jgi:hypothetical protein
MYPSANGVHKTKDSPMPNFKYGVQLPDQDHLSFNAVVFATAEEAEVGGRELLSRWFAPIGYEVVGTKEEVNYHVINNQIRPITVNLSKAMQDRL